MKIKTTVTKIAMPAVNALLVPAHEARNYYEVIVKTSYLEETTGRIDMIQMSFPQHKTLADNHPSIVEATEKCRTMNEKSMTAHLEGRKKKKENP